MEIKEFCAHPRTRSLFRRRKLPLWQGNADLLRHNADRLREAHILDFANEAEDVPGGLAAEAMIELAHRVNGEGRRLFLVEWAKTRVVLRTGFAQADVAFDHLDDVGLLLDGLGEVGHGGLY